MKNKVFCKNCVFYEKEYNCYTINKNGNCKQYKEKKLVVKDIVLKKNKLCVYCKYSRQAEKKCLKDNKIKYIKNRKNNCKDYIYKNIVYCVID